MLTYPPSSADRVLYGSHSPDTEGRVRTLQPVTVTSVLLSRTLRLGLRFVVRNVAAGRSSARCCLILNPSSEGTINLKARDRRRVAGDILLSQRKACVKVFSDVTGHCCMIGTPVQERPKVSSRHCMLHSRGVERGFVRVSLPEAQKTPRSQVQIEAQADLAIKF